MGSLAARQALATSTSVAPGDELHGQEQLAVGHVQVEHLGDVRVVEGGGDPRLVQEHLDELLLAGDVREDLLEHHQLAEARQAALRREEDLRHPARRQAAEHLVFAQHPAAEGVRSERQRGPTHLRKTSLHRETPFPERAAGILQGGRCWLVLRRGVASGRGSERDFAHEPPDVRQYPRLGLSEDLLPIPQAPQSPGVRLSQGRLRAEHDGDLPGYPCPAPRTGGGSPWLRAPG